jgi:predicted glycosyltransferase
MHQRHAAAIGARALSSLTDVPWRVLVGHNLPETDFAAYRDGAPNGVTVERARPDFPALLANCRGSIYQGGYNTVMETLAVRTPAVCIPYAGGLESEQTLRCRLLADRGALEIIGPDNVNAPAVAAVVDRAVASAGPEGRAPASGRDQAGATSSAQILREMLETAPIFSAIRVTPAGLTV